MKASLVILCLFIIGLFYSCINIYNDISKDVEFKHLIKNCFELKEDVFLVYFTECKSFALEAAGLSSTFPPTISAYYDNPTGWDISLVKVVGVIPKGTKLTIHRIVSKSNIESYFVSFYAKVDDPRYSHLEIDILFLLNSNFSEKQYSIEEHYLQYSSE